LVLEKVSRTDRVRNVEVLYRVKEERNIIDTVKSGKVNFIERKVEGGMEVTGIQERKRKQLLDYFKERRG
jgi:hypothetical protein